MICSTEGCGWNGELPPERRFERDNVTHCGLCCNPVVTSVASEMGQLRRDQDAENQPELAAEAEHEFSDEGPLDF